MNRFMHACMHVCLFTSLHTSQQTPTLPVTRSVHGTVFQFGIQYIVCQSLSDGISFDQLVTLILTPMSLGDSAEGMVFHKHISFSGSSKHAYRNCAGFYMQNGSYVRRVVTQLHVCLGK